MIRHLPPAATSAFLFTDGCCWHGCAWTHREVDFLVLLYTGRAGMATRILADARRHSRWPKSLTARWRHPGSLKEISRSCGTLAQTADEAGLMSKITEITMVAIVQNTGHGRYQLDVTGFLYGVSPASLLAPLAWLPRYILRFMHAGILSATPLSVSGATINRLSIAVNLPTPADPGVSVAEVKVMQVCVVSVGFCSARIPTIRQCETITVTRVLFSVGGKRGGFAVASLMRATLTHSFGMVCWWFPLPLLRAQCRNFCLPPTRTPRAPRHLSGQHFPAPLGPALAVAPAAVAVVAPARSGGRAV